MTRSDSEFREHLIDYLYGTLEGEALRAFEAHLRESEPARRELAALQATLRTARAGLESTSSDTPPAHVRRSVLAAAAAQANKVPDSAPLPAARPEDSDAGGFVRWLRASWLLPTLAVAAAVGLIVFGKNGEPPQVPAALRSMAPTASSAPPPSAAAPAAPQTATKAEKLEPSATEAKAKASPADRQAVPAKVSREGSRLARGAERGFAAPPPAWNAQRAPALHEEAAGKPLAQPQPTQRDTPAPVTSGAPPMQRSAAAQDARLDAVGALRATRSEPRRAVSLGPDAPDELLGGDLMRPAAPAPAAQAAPPARAPSDNFARPAAEPARARANTKEPTLSLNDLMRRASEHSAARRWQQAAADYRELLKRFPKDPRVDAWKKQLALATQALAHEGTR